MDVYVSVATQRQAEDEEFDVEAMGVACVAALAGSRVYYFEEGDWQRLHDLLSRADLVVGVGSFARKALEYVVGDLPSPYLGVQERVSEAAETRVSLDNVSQATLDRERPDAIQLPLEWQNERYGKVRRMLKDDALLLRELHRRIEAGEPLMIRDPESMETREIEVDLGSYG